MIVPDNTTKKSSVLRGYQSTIGVLPLGFGVQSSDMLYVSSQLTLQKLQPLSRSFVYRCQREQRAV